MYSTAHPHQMEFTSAASGDLGQTPLAELVDDESLNLKCNLTFTNKEWEQLEELCNLLSPFAEATDKTQGDRVRQL